MDPLGPFERAPALAVAVSGGADSLALVLLADRWARRRGGAATALTVDHGLRPESAREAREVAGSLASLGIPHHVLEWRGPKPSAGVQAAARAARYELLTSWCRRAGVLHLLLAHHRDDQAETFLMRLARGSGASGLACMSAVVETADLRILRPLLGVPRDRLAAYLKKRRVGWIEDPSNRDPAYARTRIRAMLPVLADAGLPSATWADTAGRMARPRIAGEDACARLLGRSATIHRAGYAIVEASEMAGAPRDVGLRALSRLLLCIGGGDFGPRERRLARLHGLLVCDRLGRGRTLGGCRVVALPAKAYGENRILICRESRPAPAPMLVRTGGQVVWDEYFVVELAGRRRRGAPALWLARLGPVGWARVAPTAPSPRSDPIPPLVRPLLPALVDRDGVVQAPHLDFARTDADRVPLRIERVSFRPRYSLSDTGFFLA